MPTLKDLEQVGRDWMDHRISKLGAMRKLIRHLQINAYTIRSILYAYENPVTGERSYGYSDPEPSTLCPTCSNHSVGPCPQCRQLEQQEQQRYNPGVAREGASHGREGQRTEA